MSGTELDIRTHNPGAALALRSMTEQQVETIKATVAKGASDAELEMFLTLAARYGLDPFAKEIWFYKRGSESVIMTSRDGYLSVADRNPAYQGMHSDVIREGDEFRVSMRNGKVEEVQHSYGAKRGPIMGAYALVYRSDRTLPSYFFAPREEYDKKQSAWSTNPSAMIQKCAEAAALKRAFSISGMVTREEIDARVDYIDHHDGATAAPSTEPEDSRSALQILVDEFQDFDVDQIKQVAKGCGADTTRKMRGKLDEIREALRAIRASELDANTAEQAEAALPGDGEQTTIDAETPIGAPAYGREPS